MIKAVEERKMTLAEKLKERATNVKAKELEEICIILTDISTSMDEACSNGESKLMAVKRSVPYLQARGSYLMYSLIAFGSVAYLIQQPTSNFSTIIIQADHLITQGMTNIPAALKLGVKMTEESTALKKRMILMTDGQNNEDQRFMEPSIQACIDKKVVVDTIAFGRHADINLLKSISKRTGGVFQEADSPLALQQAYAKLNFQVRYLEHKIG
jgi:Mg-chelatase subunit ChlD